LAIARDELGVGGGECLVHPFEPPITQAHGHLLTLPLEQLRSYRVIDGEVRARLYFLPQRPLSPDGEEVLETVVRVVGTSLAHWVRVKRLQQNVMIDPLTSCYNKRALDEFVDQTIVSAQRYGSDLSAIMLDLDHFKEVNDTYGHQAGDAVLKAVAQTLLKGIRKCDYLIRYGGEEFILIMPATSLARAVDVAERLRRAIEALPLSPNGHSLRVTASFGVAEMKPGYDRDRLIREVDQRLYAAKTLGRNRIVPSVQALPFETMALDDRAGRYLN
jgi:diguanylate cyclase (GGDEF)-like protein